jgi:hypothetical protein
VSSPANGANPTSHSEAEASCFRDESGRAAGEVWISAFGAHSGLWQAVRPAHLWAQTQSNVLKVRWTKPLQMDNMALQQMGQVGDRRTVIGPFDRRS